MFAQDSSGPYTVERNHFEVISQAEAICTFPTDCMMWTTWAMGAHAGDRVNDYPTYVGVTNAPAAVEVSNICSTPTGGAGTVTINDR